MSPPMLPSVKLSAIQGLQRSGASGVKLLQFDGVDEELHPQVLIDLGFALGLRESSHGVEVVGLDAVEVILGLGVNHAEYGVSVGLARDVGDAPVVANDGGGAGVLFLARGVGVLRGVEDEGRAGERGDEDEGVLHGGSQRL